jgi:hypothetical protein
MSNSKLSSNEDKANAASEHDITFQGLRNAGVLISLVVFAALARGCSLFDSEENITSRITNTSEIIRETDEFIGESVTIRSKVIRRVGSSSFTVKDRRFFGGKPIVVINASGVPFDLPRNRNIEVHVTGQVRNLDIAKIERDFKLNIQDEYYKDFINQTAIIARYIALSPKPSQVTTNPEQFYGKKVAIMGKVENIQNSVLLKLDEDKLIGGEDLLVLLTRPSTVAINKGQTVAIMGEIRPFVLADIEQNFQINLNWDWDVKKKLEAQYYSTAPVLVADSVYP